MTSLDLSAVLLTRNEGKNIGPLLERLSLSLKKLGISYEVIIVDGGSTDETRDVAVRSGAKVFLQKRLGYGGALREGFSLAKGHYVLTLDTDLSHPPELAEELWARRETADVLVGSRFTKGGESEAPLFRHILSTFLNGVFTTLLKVPVKDLSSGYRLYRREVLLPDAYQSENFNVLQEILVRAYSDGFKVVEVPLKYEARASGTSNVSLVKFAISYLPTLYRLWSLRNSSDAADYEDRAYRSRHFLQRYWIRKRAQFLTKLCPLEGSVLDVGCGSSYFTRTRKPLVALDIAPTKLRFLREWVSTRVQGRAESLPFKNGSFDVVVLSEVLQHTASVTSALNESHRVLREKGTLLIAVPDSRRLSWKLFGALYKMLPNIAHDTRLVQFSRNQLVDLIADSGFRAVTYRYICGAELILKCEKIG